MVYLNGIEIPCPSVSVSYGVGMIPEATLSFPPHRLLHRIGADDRIEVVVFYLDDLADASKPEFRLLFEGEIVGWSYSNSPAGRQITFNAVADIAVFTQMNFYFLNTTDAVVGHVAAQDAQGVPRAGAVYPFSLFHQGLVFTENIQTNNPPKPNVTRPFEILYNVVKGLVDVKLDAQTRAVPAVNFFARWVRKRNFINRFAALPLFEEQATPNAGVFPILQAAQATQALETLQNSIATSVGNTGTIMDTLREVFGYVLFEIAMLPTAPIFRANLADGTILGSPENPAPTHEESNRKPLRLLNYFVKPQMFFGIAPMCNVFFPSMISNYGYSENYLKQPTRTYVSDQLISGVLAQNALTSMSLQLGYPEEINAVLKAKVNGSNKTPKQVASSGKNVLVYPEEFYMGPVTHRMPVPKWFTYLMNQVKKNDVNDKTTMETLLSSYVSYEHYRARYAQRGGAVNMAWNPYPVPGFPCVVFDGHSSGFHTVGYLNSVVQSLSVGNMSTSVNYTMSRTMPEMLGLLEKEITKTNKTWGSAPLEPVASIRDIIQDFTQAESFYNGLFFRKQPQTGGKKAAFDFREVVEYENDDSSTEAIYAKDQQYTLPNTPSPMLPSNAVVNAAGFYTTPQTNYVMQAQPAKTANQPINNLTDTRQLVPTKGYAAMFANYQTAMQTVSRPICTLDEYVLFLHGGDPNDLANRIDELEGQGQVALGDTRFGNVSYYKRIKKMNYIAVDKQTVLDSITNVTTVNGVAAPYPGQNTAAPSNPPATPVPGVVYVGETRSDWDSILQAYRAEMYERKGPHQ